MDRIDRIDRIHRIDRIDRIHRIDKIVDSIFNRPLKIYGSSAL